MRVTIVENMAGSDPGQVGRALAEAGAEVAVVRPYLGEPLPPGPGHTGSPDGLVVLGGEQNALADDSHSYLPALAQLMCAHAGAGTAVLGICLGAQVFARGLGAANLIGAAPEFGWRDVALTEAGRNDPVLSAAGERFPVFQWHDDSFTAPPGAHHLADSPSAAQQAFRFGRAGYGTQFHFEADRPVVAGWIAAYPGAVERAAPGWIARYPDEAGTSGPAADAAGLALARAWVARI
ncbi:MAG: type 1 glutamine amidotransferase [Paracoccaceae bacterium]